MLALHGWLDNAASFEPLAPYLGDFDVVAIDLPGHGHSDHLPTGQPYRLSYYVAEALQALDVLGWAKCCLLGHSLGGAVSTLLAVVAPERVTAVSLIDQIGPLSEAPDQFPARLKRSIEAHAATAVQEPPEYPTLEDLIERRRRAGGIGDQGARLLVTRNARRTETGYRWGSDSRLRLPAPLYLDEAQARAILMTIKCPVQMIMASDGLIAARANTVGRIEAMTTLTVEKMTGGHHLHMDDPEPVAAVVVPFLARHCADSD